MAPSRRRRLRDLGKTPPTPGRVLVAIGDAEAYHHELRHYTLPFLFAFEQMHKFRVRQELVSFFTSAY